MNPSYTDAPGNMSRYGNHNSNYGRSQSYNDRPYEDFPGNRNHHGYKRSSSYAENQGYNIQIHSSHVGYSNNNKGVSQAYQQKNRNSLALGNQPIDREVEHRPSLYDSTPIYAQVNRNAKKAHRNGNDKRRVSKDPTYSESGDMAGINVWPLYHMGNTPSVVQSIYTNPVYEPFQPYLGESGRL